MLIFFIYNAENNNEFGEESVCLILLQQVKQDR